MGFRVFFIEGMRKDTMRVILLVSRQAGVRHHFGHQIDEQKASISKQYSK